MTPRYAACGHLLYVTAEGVLMAVPFDVDRLEPTGEPAAVARNLSVRGLGRADVSVSSSGTLVYTSGSISLGLGELSWVSRAGVATAIDTAWTMRFGGLTLSPDGSRVATSIYDGTSRSVWVKDLDGGPSAKFTLERERNDFPFWSPDGRTLAFTAATGSEPFAVYAGPADGSTTPTLLRRNAGTITSATFGPDGRHLILQIRGDIFLASTEGDTALTPLVASRAVETGGRVSPDGRWLAYTSDESGRLEILVRPFPNTEVSKRQVSTNGGSSVRWSRDGREIFFVDADRNLVVKPVIAGAAFVVGQGKVLFSTQRFYGSTQFLSYDVHPDGRRFIMSRNLGSATRPDQVIVVQNFFEELKRK
jgi:WD40 repeat protein